MKTPVTKKLPKRKAVAARPARKTTESKPAIVPPQKIRAVSRQIVKMFKPEKVILFGAYASGQPDPKSDVELLVVTPSDQSLSQRDAQAAARLLDVPFPLNLLIHTSAEVLEHLMAEDSQIREIILNGQVLFEKKTRTKR
ncbi:MAG TPA: nucleotidyltransferase domain-containing protein [Anaerolineae bacterium]